MQIVQNEQCSELDKTKLKGTKKKEENLPGAQAHCMGPSVVFGDERSRRTRDIAWSNALLFRFQCR